MVAISEAAQGQNTQDIFSTDTPDAHTTAPAGSKVKIAEHLFGHDVHRVVKLSTEATIIDLLNGVPLPEAVTRLQVSKREGLFKKQKRTVNINGEPDTRNENTEGSGRIVTVVVPLIRGERPTYPFKKGDVNAIVPVELYVHPGLLAKYAR